jgi:DNA-binding response OmpR family regulator
MSTERLLVVDDEADFGTFVRRVAEKLGFETRVTTRADEFKKIYGDFKPTVIALDMVMPDVDGIELVRWLVAMRTEARIVIISGFDPNYAKAAELLGNVAGVISIMSLKKPDAVTDLENALLAYHI